MRLKTLSLSILLFAVHSPLAAQMSDASARHSIAALDSSLSGAMVYPIGNNQELVFQKPRVFQFVRNAVGDFPEYCKVSFQKKHLVNIGAITAITALMVAYDQPIYEETLRIGRRLNISSHDKTKTYISVAGVPVFRGPSDLSSTLYFIGDGWTHTTIAASFLAYGLAKHDSRALQTASQLAEGMITTGLSTQLLKHITGRETPIRADAPGGVWRPFPNQIDYHKQVPNYDAFPSGHLATAMMTVTVIAENYPEHSYIRPLGYTLMALCSFQMVNNGVHWVSDYPLAMAMGYSFGKIAVHHGRKVISRGDTLQGQASPKGPATSMALIPMLSREGKIGLTLRCEF